MKHKKIALKNLMRVLRVSQPEDERKRNDQIIAEKLFALSAWKKAEKICTYVSMDDEVDTRQIIERAWKEGKKVCVPRVTDNINCAVELEILEKLEQLQPSNFGVHEPVPGTCVSAAKEKIGLVLVPGLAFAPNLHRLGFGMGYYDRLLKDLGHARKIGLAFDFQIVQDAQMPIEAHDVQMDLVLTEKREFPEKTAKK